MEPQVAFKKRARASGDVGGLDRLSSLPDCILHTIMSFLKARQAVQTCVLSTRWRHLWRSVPCLNIDFDEFNNESPAHVDRLLAACLSSSSDSSISESDTSDSDGDTVPVHPYYTTANKDWDDFEDFAVTLMHRCNIAQLDSFRLRVVRCVVPKFGNRLAAGWLRRAMKYRMPDCASGSWRLKRLHLCFVLLDDHFVKRLSSVCPSLEDLELDDCSCQIQSITSHSLKTLVLRKCRWRSLSDIISPTLKTLVIDGGLNISASALVILAPALAYLHLAVNVYRFCSGVSLNEVPSIGKAFIHLLDHQDNIARSKLDGDQFKLFCSLSNSTNLELSGFGTRVLGKEPRIQEFKNLKNLLLDDCDLSDDFRTLVFFLRSSPILEKLTLRCCKFPNYSKKEHIDVRYKMSSSNLRGLDLLCENLKVEIIYKNGSGSHLMRLLLHISVNLSKNNIKLTKLD